MLVSFQVCNGHNLRPIFGGVYQDRLWKFWSLPLDEVYEKQYGVECQVRYIKNISTKYVAKETCYYYINKRYTGSQVISMTHSNSRPDIGLREDRDGLHISGMSTKISAIFQGFPDI